MRYSEINFLAPDHLTVPLRSDLWFDADRPGALLVQIRDFEDCKFRAREEECTVVQKESGQDVGTLWFDISAIRDLQCVVIGMAEEGEGEEEEESSMTYYILVTQKTALENEYARIGVGRIKAWCVSKAFRKGRLL
jgi:hypothetical protein